VLKGNLATRPFYNERLVSLVVALIAIAGLALAAFNVTQVLSLTQRRGELLATVDQNRSEAGRIGADAERERKSLNVKELEALAAATSEANTLIDQRTFSWTAFFGYVEKTLPLDAYLMGVAPRVEKGEFRVRMLLVSKTSHDVDDFMDALDRTGAFYDVFKQDENHNDDGTFQTEVEAVYAPWSPPKKTPATPSPAGGKGRP
jgi:hypothetical protein